MKKLFSYIVEFALNIHLYVVGALKASLQLYAIARQKYRQTH